MTADVYKVTIAASAKRELFDLSTRAIERVLPKIRELANGPSVVESCAASGISGEFASAIIAWSTRSAISTKTVDVTRIAHRRDVYD